MSRGHDRREDVEERWAYRFFDFMDYMAAKGWTRRFAMTMADNVVAPVGFVDISYFESERYRGADIANDNGWGRA